MNLFLTEPGDEPFLLDELRRAFPDAGHVTLAAGLVQSDAVLQPLSHTLQQVISDRVPQRVVDHLETIEIEKEHGHLPAAPLGVSDGDRQAVLE